MVEREVIWTQTAIDQFEVLLFFLQANNVTEKFAHNITTKLNEHIQLILQYPKCGKPYKMSKIREFVFDGFNIFYRVKTRQIIIHLFWDNRQDPVKLVKLLTNIS
jgi:hypothetical protein